MTLFAGIIDFNNHVADATCVKLRSSLSRHPSEIYQEYRRPDVYIVKIDVGALTPLPPIIDERGATFICGDPLLADGEPLDRLSQAKRIHASIADINVALSTATGGFCGVHYNGETGQCVLFTDKLAIRPVYYSFQKGRLIFGSALRILLHAELPLSLTVDPVGLAGQLAHIPLGAATPYSEIKCLNAGEAIAFSRNSETPTSYWRWSEIEPESVDIRTSAQSCLDAFRSAVKRRLQGERCVQAFLSGGLDSRLIVTALKEEGANLHTFNFSRNETADKIIARQFAKVIGSSHHEGQLPTARMIALQGDIFSSYLDSYIGEGECYQGSPPDRSRIVWSGDGGSVCLGHVYMNTEMVDAFRKNNAVEIIEQFPTLLGFLPERIFSHEQRLRLAKSLVREITSELSAIERVHEDRRLYFYFLLNDQRRHLYPHFEEIDLHRIELETPFFDSDFISAVARTPISFGLKHVLYHEILGLLPNWCREVAWQTYPEHLPCPLPLPTGAEYQWAEKSSEYKAQSHAYWTKVALQLSFGKLPHVLRRSRIMFYCLLHILLRKDFSYVFRSAADVTDIYAMTSSGR